jgi:hypothetical protein
MGVGPCEHQESCLQAAGYAASTAYEARHVEGLGVPPDRITMVSRCRSQRAYRGGRRADRSFGKANDQASSTSAT